MVLIAAVLGAFVAASIQIGVLHRGDLVLSIALSLLFFAHSRTALLFAIVGGFFLDLSSALFGIRLLSYPLIVMVSHKLSTSLLDRSVVSAVIIGVLGYLAFTLFFALASVSIALIRHGAIPFSLTPFAWDTAIGALAQMIYMLGSAGIAILFKKR